MVQINSPTSTIGRAECIRIAGMALRWCRRELGENRRKKYRLEWYINKDNVYGDMGEYDPEDHTIYIYWHNNPKVRDLVETCIHEYVHSLQPIATKYWKYPGTYSRNPYERQAKYYEKKYLPACWAHISKQINKR